MRRILLPLLWVIGLVMVACSAIAPQMGPFRGVTGPDLGHAGGATIGVEARPTPGFSTKALAVTTGDVATYLFELRRVSDNSLAASFSTTSPTARFVQVPDGGYFLKADARNGSNLSLVLGGMQSSANTANVTSPNVTFSSGSMLTVSLQLLHGTGVSIPVNVQAPFGAAFATSLQPISGNTVAIATHESTVASFEYRNVLDGTYRVWAFAHDGAGSATPAGESNLVTVAGNGSSFTGPFQVFHGASVAKFAGGGVGDGGPAQTSGKLSSPRHVAVDGSGHVYLADFNHHRVRMIPASNGTFFTIAMQAGRIYTIAGNGVLGSGGDGGPGRYAQLNNPYGVAIDGAGHVYISDSGNHKVRKVTAGTGIISTYAGTGTPGATDGAPASAQFNSPRGLAFDAANNLYIADTTNNKIRQVNAAGTSVTTFAGTGVAGFGGDSGAATVAQLNGPIGLGVGATGEVYIADTLNHRIRRVSSGIITTSAGTGTAGGTGDGASPASAQLNSPCGVTADGAGVVYIADTGNNRVRSVNAAGTVISAFAGSGVNGGAGDGGSATAAQLSAPEGVAVNGSTLVITDTGSHRARQVGAGVITGFAGNGTNMAGDDCPAEQALFSGLYGLSLDPNGNVLVADETGNQVKMVCRAAGTYFGRVMTAGNIYHLAGKGSGNLSGDSGLATVAEMNAPRSCTMDTVGNLYIADGTNGRIRKVDTTGTMSTFVSGLNIPVGLAFDTVGNLFVSETGLDRVQKIPAGTNTPSVFISTAGSQPKGMVCDKDGNVYICYSNLHTVVRVTPGGSLTSVAGTNGVAGNTGDGGMATASQLNSPRGVWLDKGGHLYIATNGGSKVRMVSPGGKIFTVAGNGSAGTPVPEALATSSNLTAPNGVVSLPGGKLLVTAVDMIWSVQ